MVVVYGSSSRESISFVIMIKTMLVVRDPFRFWKGPGQARFKRSSPLELRFHVIVLNSR